ncbi:MAG: hypothetical protein CR984_02495 [Proteobacteria bacterium]|nr:MAG: hypothetical protein CR984_02495 [Pseudomonadota bacterium]
MIRNKDAGYALLTVVAILLAVITAALLPMGQLVRQARSDVAQYITVMKRAKFQRAYYGRVAEQAGGQAMSCGGLFSDHFYRESDADIATRGFVLTRRHMMTENLQNGKTDQGLNFYANDFVYRPDLGFWSGYRGRRYVYPGPADDWDENQLGFVAGLDIPGYQTSYRSGTGSQFEFGGSCITWPKLGPKNDPRNRRPPVTYYGFYFLIEDYTCTPANRMEMWMMRSSYAGDVVAVFSLSHLGTDTSTRNRGYCTHTFFFHNRDFGKRVRGLYVGRSGLHKIGIRVDGQTMYTTAIAVPVINESDVFYYNEAFVQKIAYGK